MKFFEILLISMIAHVANGQGVKMQVENAGSTYNKYIVIDRDDNERIKRTKIQDWIMGDDWMIDYIIEDDEDEIQSNSTSFCNAEPSSQGANVADLLMKALGVEEMNCPIKMQEVRQPNSVVEGELEIDGYDHGETIYVIITLKKALREILEIKLAGSLENN